MEIAPAHVAIQLVIFLTVLAVLNHLVFQPILEIMALRKKATEEKEKEAAEITGRVDKIAAQYFTSMNEAKEEARRKVSAAQNEAAKERKTLLDDARKQSQEIFSSKKTEVEATRGQVLADIKQQVERLSDELVAAVTK